MSRVDYQVSPGGSLQGEAFLPGDKSISHRAIILGSLAKGQTIIHDFLTGNDCIATLNAMQSLGVPISQLNPGTVVIEGVGLQGLTAPIQSIDCGNSGTSMRLLAGMLAAQPFNSILQGDISLEKRPMERIVLPLESMGAKIQGRKENNRIFPPLSIDGNPNLKGIRYVLPVASAQVKSCLLLAGLYAKGQTTIVENQVSRDHTERMLQAFACALEIKHNEIILTPGGELSACEIFVPGDISSGAFFIAGASMLPGAHILLRQVGLNPTRTGIIEILKQMGANIVIHSERYLGSELVGDIEVFGTQLHGITIGHEWVAKTIDEFPILFIAAACAHGETIIRGATELRFKETDRIDAMAKGLKTLGVPVEVFPDGILIQGAPLKGGTVESYGDHRVAMAFAISGLIATDTIIIHDCDNIATSFPNFEAIARKLGLSIQSYTKD